MYLDKKISLQLILYFLLSLAFLSIFKQAIYFDEITITIKKVTQVISYEKDTNSFLFATIFSFICSVLFSYQFLKYLKLFLKQDNAIKIIVFILISLPLWFVIFTIIL